MTDAGDLGDVPYFAGRGATPDDVDSGEAVFAQDPPGHPYTINLPKRARLQNGDGIREDIILVQAENHSTSDDVVIGYRNRDGGFGIALLSEVELL